MPALSDESAMPADLELDRLFEAARAARRHAYAPYSGYAVGAALRTASGRIFSGCNVENAAYPVGLCAEAGAIAAMIAAGEREISAIAIVADGGASVTPCGACRQRLREFGRPDLLVHAGDSERILARYTLDALLPHAFGPDNLDDKSRRRPGR